MLTLEEGTFLVKTARRVIEAHIRGKRPPSVKNVSEELKKPRGVFVTLTKHGELRGCIGHPMPTMPLIDALVDSAISSATRDPRFPPLEVSELDKILVEVSVLTEPKPIEVDDPREYPGAIVVGRDGLIVEYGGHAGLLLPQVAVEWKWDAEEFLSHACMKAGLMPDAWLDRGIRISRFSAQVFSERTPGGKVEERGFEER